MANSEESKPNISNSGPWASWANLLLGLGLVLMLVNVYFIFMVAPIDAVLGNVQRVFYFHVPIAIMSFLAFFLVFIASVVYLVKRSEKWDRLAHAKPRSTL